MKTKFKLGDIVSHKCYDVCGYVVEVKIRDWLPTSYMVEYLPGFKALYRESDLIIDTKAKRLSKLIELGI